MAKQNYTAEQIIIKLREVEIHCAHGYRRITALLRAEGFGVNHKRVERIWRQQVLKVRARTQNEDGFGKMKAPVSGCGLTQEPCLER